MAWRVERYEGAGLRAREQRLTDLILSGVIGHGWPNYWLDASNVQKRIDEILNATAAEVMPWEH